MRPTIHIIRGLPGSGKTTLALKIVEETNRRGLDMIHLGTDMLLTAGETYHYTPEAHKRAVEALQGICVGLYKQGLRCNLLICGVFSRKESVRQLCGAISAECPQPPEIVVLDMPLLTVDQSMARNQHGVRREDIERMAAQWEPWEAPSPAKKE